MSKQQSDMQALRPPVRVGLADDHDSVRTGLEKLLRGFPEFDVAGSARNGTEARDLVASEKIDLLMLDVAMPGQGAFDVLENLLAIRKRLRVLIFTGFPEQRYAVHLARLGARGYLDKAASLEEIVDALRAVASGKTYFSARVDRLIASGQDKDGADAPDSPAAALTAREFRIFLRLAAGERVPQIAKALGVSEVTVSTYRASLLAKLKLGTNSHVTEFALKNRFLL